MEILIIILGIILIFCVRHIKNKRANSIEATRAQFNPPESTTDTGKLSINDTTSDEDCYDSIEDMYEDVKQDPNNKENWYGLSEEEMEEIYYRLKKEKIHLSDTMYKYISNIIGGQYEDDLLDELQYVDEYAISEWIDEKRREKRFLTSKVWRKIKTIQRKNY